MKSCLIFLTLISSFSSVLIIAVIADNSGVLDKTDFLHAAVFEIVLFTKVDYGEILFSLLVLSFKANGFLLVGVISFFSSTFLNSIGS